jgi:hypothetical protein
LAALIELKGLLTGATVSGSLTAQPTGRFLMQVREARALFQVIGAHAKSILLDKEQEEQILVAVGIHGREGKHAHEQAPRI